MSDAETGGTRKKEGFEQMKKGLEEIKGGFTKMGSSPFFTLSRPKSMLHFVKLVFRGFFEVILWLNLIVSTIFGGVLGRMVDKQSYRGGGGYLVLGVIIGLIVGFLTNVIVGGYLATILNIDENLEQLKNSKNLGSLSPHTGNDSPSGSMQETTLR
jgi:hypothetical protein